jgi:hypothetical protein
VEARRVGLLCRGLVRIRFNWMEGGKTEMK